MEIIQDTKLSIKQNSQCKQILTSKDPVPTLNQQGYMLTSLDEYREALIKFAPNAPGPILDVGTAYGFMSLELLKTGAYVIANDMDVRHLEVLRDCVLQQHASRLEICPGKIPGDVNFIEESLGAVFASGVLHFLPAEELPIAFANIFLWLKPGGKFFFSSPTPYSDTFQHFRPIYERNKLDGVRLKAFSK